MERKIAAERKTSQRSALLKAFESAGRPLSPQEALELARPLASGLGIATVYRNLRTLAEQGVLKPVRLPGESTARYELCGKAHHHHFHCRRCHQVFEVDGCPGNIEPLVPRGFVLEDHEVVLYGQCPACKPPPRRKSEMRSAKSKTICKNSKRQTPKRKRSHHAP